MKRLKRIIPILILVFLLLATVVFSSCDTNSGEQNIPKNNQQNNTQEDEVIADKDVVVNGIKSAVENKNYTLEYKVIDAEQNEYLAGVKKCDGSDLYFGYYSMMQAYVFEYNGYYALCFNQMGESDEALLSELVDVDEFEMLDIEEMLDLVNELKEVSFEKRNDEFNISGNVEDDTKIKICIKNIGNTKIINPNKEKQIKSLEEKYFICTVYDGDEVVGYAFGDNTADDGDPIDIQLGARSSNKNNDTGVGKIKTGKDGQPVMLEGVYADKECTQLLDYTESINKNINYTVQVNEKIEKLYVKFKDVTDEHTHSFIRGTKTQMDGCREYYVKECAYCSEKSDVTSDMKRYIHKFEKTGETVIKNCKTHEVEECTECHERLEVLGENYEEKHDWKGDEYDYIYDGCKIYQELECKDCHKSKKGDFIKYEHSYDEGFIKRGCEIYEQKVCYSCGHKEEESFSDIHNYEIVEDSIVTNGCVSSCSKKCTECNDIKENVKLGAGHNMKLTSDPRVDESGDVLANYKCANCEYTKENVVVKHDHSYEESKYGHDDCGYYYSLLECITCGHQTKEYYSGGALHKFIKADSYSINQLCGQPIKESFTHTGGAVTFTRHYCNICAIEYDVYEVKHMYESWYIVVSNGDKHIDIYNHIIDAETAEETLDKILYMDFDLTQTYTENYAINSVANEYYIENMMASIISKIMASDPSAFLNIISSEIPEIVPYTFLVCEYEYEHEYDQLCVETIGCEVFNYLYCNYCGDIKKEKLEEVHNYLKVENSDIVRGCETYCEYECSQCHDKKEKLIATSHNEYKNNERQVGCEILADYRCINEGCTYENINVVVGYNHADSEGIAKSDECFDYIEKTCTVCGDVSYEITATHHPEEELNKEDLTFAIIYNCNLCNSDYICSMVEEENRTMYCYIENVEAEKFEFYVMEEQIVYLIKQANVTYEGNTYTYCADNNSEAAIEILVQGYFAMRMEIQIEITEKEQVDALPELFNIQV